ncbi:MAG: hypothetical protein ACRDOE_00600 [Streptosporangiaceae bacterium]
MPVRKTAQQSSDNWLQHLSSATPAITSGVQGVTKAPGQAAAAQKQKWLQRVTASADKFATQSSRVSLADWQNLMINVGIPRIAQGAQAKQSKYTDFASNFLPYLQTGVSKVDAMPSVTLEDNINRAVAMIRHNSQYKRTG